jgi:DNA-binding IclR family transcriptional regulator
MVLEDDSVLFVDGVEAARLLRISVRIGAKVPAYFTAGDRALLAELPSEQLDELYPRLPRARPRSRRALVAVLAEIQAIGFSVVDDDGEPNTSVLLTASGRVRGAIGVSALSQRLAGAAGGGGRAAAGNGSGCRRRPAGSPVMT